MECAVKFSGLFTVVRHTSARTRTDAEPMTILYPDARVAGAGSGHDHGADDHVPLLFIRDDVFNAGAKIPSVLTPVEPPKLKFFPQGYKNGFHLTGWNLQLPTSGVRGGPQPVSHAADRMFGTDEPSNGAILTSVDSLSFLPNLNDLSGGQFDSGNLATPAPPLVRARVVPSGGTLRALRSEKSLRHAFFEFFSFIGTVLIQPAADEVEYVVDTETFTIGFSRLDGTDATVYQAELPLVAGQGPIAILMSLPHMTQDPPAMRTNSLQHFSLYYPFMQDRARNPLARVICRADDKDKTADPARPETWPIVHRMPTFKRVAPGFLPEPDERRTTPEDCRCLAAQTFLQK